MKKPSDHFFEKYFFKKVVLHYLQLLILPNDYSYAKVLGETNFHAREKKKKED